MNKFLINSTINKLTKDIFSKWWISGFTQADGSFVVGFDKRNQGNIPYRPRPYFILSQNKKEIVMITELHKQLGVGVLRENRNNLELAVNKLEDLQNVILPHFDKYPVRGGKFISYLIFREVVKKINNGVHKDASSFLQLLDFSYFTHDTSLRTIESKAIIEKAVEKKFGKVAYQPMIMDFTLPIPPNVSREYISGIIDGDGSINFAFRSNRRRIVPNLTVIHGLEDYSVLLDLQKYFSCGTVYKLKSEAARFQIENPKDLVSKVQPLLETTTLHTTKGKDIFHVFKA